MRVALINDTFSIRGGTERHILDAADLLAEAGIETVFVAAENEDTHRPVHVLPELFRFRLVNGPAFSTALKSLNGILTREQVDVVHLVHMHHPEVTRFLTPRWPTVRSIHTAYMFCVAGTRYLPNSGTACTQTCGFGCVQTHFREKCIRFDRDRTYSLPQQFKKLQEIEGNFETNLDLHRIAVTSQFMQDLLVQHGYRTERIDIIPPPITERMAQTITAPFPAGSPPTLLVAGRLIAEKGVFDVLQAMVQLPPEVRLIVIGDGPERPHLERDAATLGLSARVRFEGWLTPEACLERYRETWITLFPSLWPEPFGFTGIESMLNERPVVAYDGGGVREWLVHEQNGLLVPSHQPQQLAQAIRRLLENPAYCQALGQWGNRFVRERFSRTLHLERKEQFYRQAIEAFRQQHYSAAAGDAR